VQKQQVNVTAHIYYHYLTLKLQGQLRTLCLQNVQHRVIRGKDKWRIVACYEFEGWCPSSLHRKGGIIVGTEGSACSSDLFPMSPCLL
jgi:hypothetical protein